MIGIERHPTSGASTPATHAYHVSSAPRDVIRLPSLEAVIAAQTLNNLMCRRYSSEDIDDARSLLSVSDAATSFATTAHSSSSHEEAQSPASSAYPLECTTDEISVALSCGSGDATVEVDHAKISAARTLCAFRNIEQSATTASRLPSQPPRTVQPRQCNSACNSKKWCAHAIAIHDVFERTLPAGHKDDKVAIFGGLCGRNVVIAAAIKLNVGGTWDRKHISSHNQTVDRKKAAKGEKVKSDAGTEGKTIHASPEVAALFGIESPKDLAEAKAPAALAGYFPRFNDNDDDSACVSPIRSEGNLSLGSASESSIHSSTTSHKRKALAENQPGTKKPKMAKKAEKEWK